MTWTLIIDGQVAAQQARVNAECRYSTVWYCSRCGETYARAHLSNSLGWTAILGCCLSCAKGDPPKFPQEFAPWFERKFGTIEPSILAAEFLFNCSLFGVAQ